MFTIPVIWLKQVLIENIADTRKYLLNNPDRSNHELYTNALFLLRSGQNLVIMSVKIHGITSFDLPWVRLRFTLVIWDENIQARLHLTR